MMREEEEEREGRWSARWEEEQEEELPSPEELMPLSQTLITPDLALAFDIPTPSPPPADLDSAGTGGGVGCGGGGDEPARTLKRPRLVWTPQLHKRFVDAVAHLGIKNAVPKTIMQLMGVEGLTRENVASHLQKYRLYLKRMQQGLLGSSSSSSADAATDRLFASSPIPHHFLRGGEGPAFVPVAAALQQQQHHHHQMVQQQQQQFYHQRQQQQQQQQQQQMGHFGFDPGFLTRGQPQPQPGMHRMVPPVPAASYVDDLEEGSSRGGGRRVLTLFPTGED